MIYDNYNNLNLNVPMQKNRNRTVLFYATRNFLASVTLRVDVFKVFSHFYLLNFENRDSQSYQSLITLIPHLGDFISSTLT
jgi:hypothetical protein